MNKNYLIVLFSLNCGLVVAMDVPWAWEPGFEGLLEPVTQAINPPPPSDPAPVSMSKEELRELQQIRYENFLKEKERIRDAVIALCNDPNTKPEDLNKPLKDLTDLPPINITDIQNDKELLKLLLDKGADPNSMPNGYHIFDADVSESGFKELKMLLEHGFDPNIRGKCNTPLYMLVLEYEEWVDNYGRQGWQEDERAMMYKLMRLLLYHGADTYLVSKGRIPMKTVEYKQITELVDLFKRAPKELTDILTSILSRGTMHLQQKDNQELKPFKLPAEIAFMIARQRYHYSHHHAYEKSVRHIENRKNKN